MRERCCSATTRREIRWECQCTAQGLPSRNPATHRSQNRIHEIVEILRVHEAAALEYPHGQLGYDGQVALEVLRDDLAEAVIVFEGLDLLEFAETVKGVVVEVVDIVYVGVRYDDVGELLHVAEAMCYPVVAS